MIEKQAELFIKAVTVVDSSSKWNGKKVSILIQNGKISEIGTTISQPKGCKVFEAKNLHVSAGWVDMLASFGDPGYEHKESFESGLKAAAAGGFTDVVASADTNPVADHRSGIEYVLNRTRDHLVNVHPCGAITKGMKGNEMAEMHDMHQGGAKVFSDHKNSILNSRLLIKSLLYCKAFDGLLMHFPADSNVYANGQVNEGVVSTRLGLKPIPEIGEELMVNRDIKLSEYTDQRIHFNLISSANSVQQIKLAKKNKVQVSCGVGSAYLLLNEEMLEGFDSNLKLMPPLKDKTTVNLLIKGLKDNSIDVIVSDHSPQNVELKECEFNNAEFGMINLQTAFSAANTALQKHLELDEIIDKFSHNPRRILGLPKVSIEKGSVACLTFFDPKSKWKFSRKQNHSISENTPLFEKELTGQVLGIYNHSKICLNS